VSDSSPTPRGEVALRAANARLRRVVEAKDAEIAALKAGFAAELARLEARVAELERRLGQDSSNSSLPPGSDGPGAKARRPAGPLRQGGPLGTDHQPAPRLAQGQPPWK
jgi:cell division protein FtsB